MCGVVWCGTLTSKIKEAEVWREREKACFFFFLDDKLFTPWFLKMTLFNISTALMYISPHVRFILKKKTGEDSPLSHDVEHLLNP